MSFKEYLKYNIANILLNIISLIFLEVFLLSIGNELKPLVIIAIIWICVLFSYLIMAYIKRKNHFKFVEKCICNIDKKYLISEVLDVPPFIEAKPYYFLLKKSSKAMREEINKEKLRLQDYKEYIEQWIHEVKTPISLIKLIEENNRNDKSSAILMQLEEIDRYVEQALFYARSEYVDKDYLIKEISLKSCVNNVITRNKQGFILNNIDIEIENIDTDVYCDSKWLEFILHQIIVNSIKYRNNINPKVKIYLQEIKNGTKLIIEDNGIGIPKNEINNVMKRFYKVDKSRVNNNSFGIGLSIANRIANNYNAKIQIDSELDKYTIISVYFKG